MTGRPFSRPNENDAVDADPAGKRALQSDEATKKRDNDPRIKDMYEPANRRGTGTEREYPQDDATGTRDNEDIEGGNRGAA
jgi:hypothetical protein